VAVEAYFARKLEDGTIRFEAMPAK
jgi:hypothetical protein